MSFWSDIMCVLRLELRMNGQCGWRDRTPGTREFTHGSDWDIG